jgi:hypothetical protein
MLAKTICLATVMTLSITPLAESQHADGRAGFERLKRLTGTWTMGGRSGSQAVTTYRVTDGGKTLIQDEAGQLTVFKLEGDKLTLTHYCARGNQPRMRLQTLDESRITFTMYDITNLSHPRDYHTTDMELVFLNDDRVDLVYRATSAGRASTQVVRLTRKDS